MPSKTSQRLPRIATAVTLKTRKSISEHQWCVHPDNELCKNAIAEYVKKNNIGDAESVIYYNTKPVTVTKLPFEAVLELKNKRVQKGYKFVAYHREKNGQPWVAWKEGRNTPPEQLRNNNHLFVKRSDQIPLKK